MAMNDAGYGAAMDPQRHEPPAYPPLPAQVGARGWDEIVQVRDRFARAEGSGHPFVTGVLAAARWVLGDVAVTPAGAYRPGIPDADALREADDAAHAALTGATAARHPQDYWVAAQHTLMWVRGETEKHPGQ
jgi:hypothetical protein